MRAAAGNGVPALPFSPPSQKHYVNKDLLGAANLSL
jgi:hypothetical protein